MNDIAVVPERASMLLDTVKFQQVMAIADVMASASLLPQSLTHEKHGDKMVPMAFETVKANCFLVANQALNWRMDPFAVAQCCSVVHGKLMFEGKLVAAVLEANVGTRLSYSFGKWDSAKECADLSEEGVGDQLAVRVFEDLGDGNMGRHVDGHVGGWKTTGNNTPWRAGNMRKMLRYRGAREWARAHEPGIMLGVVADDEVDFENMRDVTPPRQEPSQPVRGGSIIDSLKAAQTGKQQDGFDLDRVKADTAGDRIAGAQDDGLVKTFPSSDEEANQQNENPTADASSQNTEAAGTGSSSTGSDTAESGESSLPPLSPIAEGMDNVLRNKLLECAQKLLEIPARTDIKPEAQLGVIEKAKDAWKGELPKDQHALLKRIFDTSILIVKGKVKRDEAVKYVAGILRCEPREIGGAA